MNRAAQWLFLAVSLAILSEGLWVLSRPAPKTAVTVAYAALASTAHTADIMVTRDDDHLNPKVCVQDWDHCLPFADLVALIGARKR